MYDNAIAREKTRTKNSVSPKETIDNCKTYPELESVAKSVCGFKDGITQQVKSKIGLEVTKTCVSGFSDVIKDFPEVKDNSGKIGLTPTRGVLSTNGNDLLINPTKASSTKDLNELISRMTKAKWWPQNSTIETLAMHEAGHCVEKAIIKSKNLHRYEAVQAWNKGTYSKQIVSQACRNIKKTSFGKGKKNEELIRSISNQAFERKAQETFAEAFGDFYTNGENASPLSKEIIRLAREELNNK